MHLKGVKSREKEEMMIRPTVIFPFRHDVFRCLLFQRTVETLGSIATPPLRCVIFSYPSKKKFLQMFYNLLLNKTIIFCVCNTKLLKTLREKEKLLVASNFSFSHSVFFFTLFENFVIFVNFEIVVCELYQVGRV